MKRAMFLAWLLLIAALASLGTALAQEGDPLPSIDQLEAGWNTLVPGGETVCARGTPYQFFARPGSPDKLMIYFQGGGGCWDDLTCSPLNGTFDDRVDDDELARYNGIFNFNRPINPISDYSVVVVAYCSGDFHAGDSAQTYSAPLADYEIQHRGMTNTTAVLDWTYANFPAVERLIVAGSSAGAVGTIFHADRILSHYTAENPDVQAVVIADAGVGVSAGNVSAIEQWNATEFVSTEGAYSAVDPANLVIDLTRALAQTHPDVTVALFTDSQDEVQQLFYQLLGGEPADWEREMREQVQGLQEEPNFRSFILEGTDHTILALPRVYSIEQDGVRFIEWLTAILEGEAVENVG